MPEWPQQASSLHTLNDLSSWVIYRYSHKVTWHCCDKCPSSVSHLILWSDWHSVKCRFNTWHSLSTLFTFIMQSSWGIYCVFWCATLSSKHMLVMPAYLISVEELAFSTGFRCTVLILVFKRERWEHLCVLILENSLPSIM